MKTEATKPASANVLQQQARFDRFVARYNEERPHQALAMKMPAEVYVASTRPYRGLPELDYPLHDWTATVIDHSAISPRRTFSSTFYAGRCFIADPQAMRCLGSCHSRSNGQEDSPVERS